jgi:hypothetical protein
MEKRGNLYVGVGFFIFVTAIFIVWGASLILYLPDIFPYVFSEKTQTITLYLFLGALFFLSMGAGAIGYGLGISAGFEKVLGNPSDELKTGKIYTVEAITELEGRGRFFTLRTNDPKYPILLFGPSNLEAAIRDKITKTERGISILKES